MLTGMIGELHSTLSEPIWCLCGPSVCLMYLVKSLVRIGVVGALLVEASHSLDGVLWAQSSYTVYATSLWRRTADLARLYCDGITLGKVGWPNMLCRSASDMTEPDVVPLWR